MARIALVEPQTASPEVKEIYEQTLKSKPGNVHKALAQRPQTLKNFLSFYASPWTAASTKWFIPAFP